MRSTTALTCLVMKLRRVGAGALSRGGDGIEGSDGVRGDGLQGRNYNISNLDTRHTPETVPFKTK
jgi:hypothetical protein